MDFFSILVFHTSFYLAKMGFTTLYRKSTISFLKTLCSKAFESRRRSRASQKFHLWRVIFCNVHIHIGCQALISLPLIVRDFTYQDQRIPHLLVLPLKTHFKGLAQLSELSGWFGTISNNRGRADNWKHFSRLR